MNTGNDGTEEKEWGTIEQAVCRSNDVWQMGTFDRHRSAGIKPQTVRIYSAMIRTTSISRLSAMPVGDGVTKKPAERPIG